MTSGETCVARYDYILSVGLETGGAGRGCFSEVQFGPKGLGGRGGGGLSSKAYQEGLGKMGPRFPRCQDWLFIEVICLHTSIYANQD